MQDPSIPCEEVISPISIVCVDVIPPIRPFRFLYLIELPHDDGRPKKFLKLIVSCYINTCLQVRVTKSQAKRKGEQVCEDAGDQQATDS